MAFDDIINWIKDQLLAPNGSPRTGGLVSILGLGALGALAGGAFGGSFIGIALGALAGGGVGLLSADVFNQLFSGGSGAGTGTGTRTGTGTGTRTGTGTPQDTRPVTVTSITPVVQTNITQNTSITLGTQQFSFNSPTPDTIQRPWGTNRSSVGTFMTTLYQDSYRLFDHPLNHQEARAVLERSINERNQHYFNFIESVAVQDTGLQNYTTQTRPAMMRHLGVDENTPFGRLVSPPKFNSPLNLTIPEDLERNSRIFLTNSTDATVRAANTPEAWAQLSAPAKLARLDNALQQQMLHNSTRWANFRQRAEALGRQWDWTLNPFQRLVDSSREGRLRRAIQEFMHVRINNQTNLHYGNEARFRAAIEEVANDEATTASIRSTGEQSATLLRESAALMVEEFNVHKQWSEIQALKIEWTTKAYEFFNRAQEFNREFDEYKTQFANGGRVNDNYAIVKETMIPITANTDAARTRRTEILDTQRSINAATSRATTGLRTLMSTRIEGVRRAEDMREIDLASLNLPRFHEIIGVTADNPLGPVQDDILLGDLHRTVERYNTALRAWQADRTNNAKRAAVNVAFSGSVGLPYAIQEYLSTLARLSTDAVARLDRDLQTLATESTAGTPQAGQQGVAFWVLDKRSGASNRGHFALIGVKENGIYKVTGWRIFDAQANLGEPHYFGANATDLTNAIEFNPTTMAGMDAIVTRMTAPPTAQTSITPQPVTVAQSNLPASSSEVQTQPIIAIPQVDDLQLVTVQPQPQISPSPANNDNESAFRNFAQYVQITPQTTLTGQPQLPVIRPAFNPVELAA